MPVAQYTGPKGMGVNLEHCHATPQHKLGQCVEGINQQGYPAQFMYVKFEDATAYAAGQYVAMGAGETTWNVTNIPANQMAGKVGAGWVFQNTVPTQNSYGWVQRTGIVRVLVATAAVIAGDWLKPSATAGALDEGTIGTDHDIPARAIATIANGAVGLAVSYLPAG